MSTQLFTVLLEEVFRNVQREDVVIKIDGKCVNILRLTNDILFL